MHMQQYLQAVMCYTPIYVMTKPFQGDVLQAMIVHFMQWGVDDGEDVDKVRDEKR